MRTNISQIFISDISEELPYFLQKTTSSINQNFENIHHEIYNNEKLREFIKHHYDKEVLWAYDSLRPYSYKSDLGRFCLLFELGGWYFDIATQCVLGPKINNKVDMICFRDEQRHSKTSWAVNGAVIWSKKKNSILYKSIEKIVVNCKERWYGRTPLCPTGPALFGEAIAEENRGKEIIIGDLIRPMIPFTRKNIPFMRRIFKAKYVLPNNKVIAYVKPASGGDLKSLGVKGSNNYNYFWHSKKVYKVI